MPHTVVSTSVARNNANDRTHFVAGMRWNDSMAAGMTVTGDGKRAKSLDLGDLFATIDAAYGLDHPQFFRWRQQRQRLELVVWQNRGRCRLKLGEYPQIGARAQATTFAPSAHANRKMIRGLHEHLRALLATWSKTPLMPLEIGFALDPEDWSRSLTPSESQRRALDGAARALLETSDPTRMIKPFAVAGTSGRFYSTHAERDFDDYGRNMAAVLEGHLDGLLKATDLPALTRMTLECRDLPCSRHERLIALSERDATPREVANHA